MRILHLIYDHIHNPWVGGGGAVRAYEICKRLVRQGHEVTIVSGNFPGAGGCVEDGIRFVFAGSSKNYVLSTFSYAWKAASFVKKEGQRFDVIVEDFAPWNPVFSSIMTKKPVVLHVNHLEGINILRRLSVAGLPFFLIEKVYPRFFRCITALSEETKKKIGMPVANIIPAGIDSRLFQSGQASWSGERFFLYVGRLHMKNKGLDTLLYGMKGLDMKLIIAGRGHDEDRLKQMAKVLGAENISFTGFIEERDKIHLLQNMEALILPSRFEGWGIVILEAAACGKPVIVSDIPELRYAVDAGFGISFKTGESADLASKIRLLMENGPLREEMGRKARDCAKGYTWDKIALDYERFLKGVIHNA